MRPLDSISGFPLGGVGAGASLRELLWLLECRQSPDKRAHIAGYRRQGHVATMLWLLARSSGHLRESRWCYSRCLLRSTAAWIKRTARAGSAP